MTISDQKPAQTGSSDDITAFLEGALEDARAGRILLLIASIGVVRPTPDDPPLIIGGDPVPQPPKFVVDVGGFIGPHVDSIDPESLAEATNDVLRGASYCATQVMRAVQVKVGGEPHSEAHSESKDPPS